MEYLLGVVCVESVNLSTRDQCHSNFQSTPICLSTTPRQYILRLSVCLFVCLVEWLDVGTGTTTTTNQTESLTMTTTTKGTTRRGGVGGGFACKRPQQEQSSHGRQQQQQRRLVEGRNRTNSSLWWKQSLVKKHGTTKTVMDQYRARQERKRQETARSLRSYQKACKSVGYTPGKGSNRKRTWSQNEEQHDDDGSNNNNNNNQKVNEWNPMKKGQVDKRYDDQDDNYEEDGVKELEDNSSHQQQQQQGRKTKRTKNMSTTITNRMLQKAGQKAVQRRIEKEQIREHKAWKESERLQKIQERKERNRRRKQRTVKGQPILQYQVHDILQKLQKEGRDDGVAKIKGN